tara:strand:+ start:76446 stop:77600 length:1155 start_codon:yes stop_codon:yes gene_type:complete
MLKKFIYFQFMLTSIFLLIGCGTVEVNKYLPDKAVEYKREKQAERNLEIPPDLIVRSINDRLAIPGSSSGVVTNYSEYATDRKIRGVSSSGRSKLVMPENPNIQLERDGNKRWIVVDADADIIWDRLIDFWQDQGILLEEQDPELGIMRTSWIENRANIAGGPITDVLRGALDSLYDTSLRDQYRLRIERISQGKTEIFMTHYGMEEIVTSNANERGETFAWTTRERDPELEIVMIKRVMVFLGAAEARANAQVASAKKAKRALSQLVQGADGTKLIIDDDFARSWRLIGLSLDRIGFAVEDRNRSQGIYYVRYNDPAVRADNSGIVSSLKFWGNDKKEKSKSFSIIIRSESDRTVVRVFRENGKESAGDTGKRILTLLKEEVQ